jgi:hypothetical protein
MNIIAPEEKEHLVTDKIGQEAKTHYLLQFFPPLGETSFSSSQFPTQTHLKNGKKPRNFYSDPSS